MAGYFSYFPKTLYTLDDNNNNNLQLITNILLRSAFFEDIIANKTSVFYEYQMKDDDTVEVIADKLYGDVNRYWIILLFNKIINPFYDTFLTRDALEKYIVKKYNQTIEEALTTIHHYEIETTSTRTTYYYDDGSNQFGTVTDENTETYIVSEYEVDYTTNTITPRATLPGPDITINLSTDTLTISDDPKIILTTSSKIKGISNYTYEALENEKRRTIKLLDASYVRQVEQEFTKLMAS